MLKNPKIPRWLRCYRRYLREGKEGFCIPSSGLKGVGRQAGNWRHNWFEGGYSLVGFFFGKEEEVDPRIRKNWWQSMRELSDQIPVDLFHEEDEKEVQ